MTKIKIDISFRKSQGYWALIKVTNFKRKQSELHIILSPGKQIIQEKKTGQCQIKVIKVIIE